MLYLRDITEETFILVQANWPAARARQLLEQLEASHVIIHRLVAGHTEPKDYYYLFCKEEALVRLGPVVEPLSVEHAFDLQEHDATPVMDAYTDAEKAPDRVVVMEDGRVMGFADAAFEHAGAEEPSTIVFEAVRRGGSEVLSEYMAERRRVAASGGAELPAPVVRHMVADLPRKVSLGQAASLLVSLSAEIGPIAEGRREVAVAPGSTVDVVIQTEPGFEIVGTRDGSITVVNTDESLPLLFKLRATKLGLWKVRILGFHDGQPLAQIVLAPEVVAAGGALDEQPAKRTADLAPVYASQPDLTLLILEDTSGDHVTLTIQLTATDPDLGLFFTPFGPQRLRTRPSAYFEEFFQDIDGLPLNTPEQRKTAEERITAKGEHLFETIFPKELQVLLWTLRNRIETVRIVSQEPWIPWELCRLVGEEDGKYTNGLFLCQAFNVTRWMAGIGERPSLTAKKMAVVVPESNLKHAAAERAYLLSLAGQDRKVDVVPATYLEVRTCLGKGCYDAWHFTGHGSFRGETPDQSGIGLNNREKLTPEDLSGTARNLRQGHPLVFLNACKVGRSGLSLTDIGGFAQQFIRLGAGAFIGPFWSIYDRTALDFAKAFYGNVLAGIPVGRAAQEARSAVKDVGDLTWLAYTVFAHPLAKVR